MTENLLQYIPLALRVGAKGGALLSQSQIKEKPQTQGVEMNKNHFLIDARFSLRLDEIA